jgi:hypothetical protein
MGLAMPLPAISGAEPWTGSKRDGQRPVGLMFPEGATPMEPVHAGPRSERISPKRFCERQYVCEYECEYLVDDDWVGRRVDGRRGCQLEAIGSLELTY